MKKLYLKLLALSLVLIYAGNSKGQQPLDLGINFEIKLSELYYDGFSDVSSVGELVTQIQTWDPVLGWSEFGCETFTCASTPMTLQNTSPDSYLRWGMGGAFDYEFDLKFIGMEDDDSNPCNYNPDEDDDYYEEYATWTSGFTTSITQNAFRWPSMWYSNDNDDTGGWLLPQSDIWDIKLKTAWRYTHGDDCTDPLDFGQVGPNTNVYHFNSTDRSIEAEHSQNVPLCYTNTGNNLSADVYYRIELTEPSEIVITTIAENSTNFDTYLRVFEADCATVVEENDDYIPGEEVQARIETSLSAGVYIIQVEGYSANEGQFYLGVEVGNSTLSVREHNDPDLISLYPNPATDVLNIDLSDDLGTEVTISMFNILGQEVYNSQVSGQNLVRIPVSNYPPGTYNVIVRSGTRVSYQKVIIQ